MKTVTYILIALLLVSIGGGAYLYLMMYQPMTIEHERLKAGMPEFDRAKTDLRKYKEREAWIKPTVDALAAGLSEEIKAGKAEVVVSNCAVVANISEQILYTPGSVTFAKDSPPTLEKLASLLKGLKDIKEKEILVGNATQAVPPQGRGRRKTPGKEARELAGQRSLALIKYLEKNGVPQESLVAAAYPQRSQDRGFKIKDHKTVITILGHSPAAAQMPPAKTEAPAARPQAQQKPIPILPAQPKTQ